MGNTVSCKKVNYEDLQECISNKDRYIIINTLSANEQQCLITNTVPIQKEEAIINETLQNYTEISIIIYGKNSNDDTIYKKYKQLQDLGFVNIYLYSGGLFEWLLLQDIYGQDDFPTTSQELDILKYKPVKIINQYLIK
tara:strand:+ start:115 stop:531 length:417 start_codon:yes stop_codon:yes gene_type:complete